MENNSRKGLKRRSSIITIIIVVLLIALLAFSIIKILEKNSNKENQNKVYITNLDEEDMMQYEYSKIDKSLDGMYALGIVNENLVAVQSKDKYTTIVQIDPQKEYDYVYNSAKLYLLEKESGTITIIDLNNLGNVIDTIELEDNVKAFEVYNDCIYYIANDKLIKYENKEKEEILSEITSDNFVIKKDYIYIVKNGELLKIDMDKNEEVIANNVIKLYYYNYYERDRLIYDTSSDSENVFKNIYNYYTGEITNSIKNNTDFIPFDASEYIYTTQDRKNLILIKKSGDSEYLYKSKNEINNINLFKEGYVIFEEDDKNIVIDLDTSDEIEDDNIINLHNIKYLK
jgi:hypothetical protein